MEMTVGLEEALNENDFPGNSAAFSQLKAYAEKGDVIGFTGAGVSAGLFPTWTTLLTKLLVDAKNLGFVTDPKELDSYRALAHSDPLELANFLEDAFTKKAFRARLADIFRNPSAACTDAHKIVAELRLRGIVTLNYDNAHEVSFTDKGIHPNAGRTQDNSTIARWMQGKIFEEAGTPILHFHGEVSDPENMILTGDDYYRFYGQQLPSVLLKELWRSARLLVIGFGFSDPFLTRVAEETLRGLETDNVHFAIIGRRRGQPTSSIDRRMFARKFRLTPIFYEIHESDANGTISEDHRNLVSS